MRFTGPALLRVRTTYYRFHHLQYYRLIGSLTLGTHLEQPIIQSGLVIGIEMSTTVALRKLVLHYCEAKVLPRDQLHVMFE